ncbi:DUF2514 family protein [Pigmentiphaga sp. CHJ604]|uniref:DUF2514 family protein n=1 Tax=Pigmentiphaga sp. CHJ604 TaxID=3081984 RepID=UPI0030D2FB3E
MIPAWLRYGAVAALAGIAVGVAQGWRYGERIAALEWERSEERLALANRAREAEAATRAEESRRQAAIDEVTQDAQKDLDAAVRRERAAADVRVRDAVNAYAAHHRPAAGPGAAPAGSPAGDPLGMLADLLGELDGLAESYAATADRARIAGMACERAYDSLSPAP